MARRYSARVDLAPAPVVLADLVVHHAPVDPAALVVRADPADLAPRHQPVVLVPVRRVQAAPVAVPAQVARALAAHPAVEPWATAVSRSSRPSTGSRRNRRIPPAAS